MSMHPIKKVYCRAFQTVFHLAIPLLPYRRPEILTGTDLLPGLFREKGVRRVLLVTDASIRGLGITAHTEELLAREGIQCTVYDRTVANPTTDNVEEARGAVPDQRVSGHHRLRRRVLHRLRQGGGGPGWRSPGRAWRK